jgi:recombination protein RecT
MIKMTKQESPNKPAENQVPATRKAPLDLMKLDSKGLVKQAEPVFTAMGLPREQFVREAGYAMQMMLKTPYLMECDRGTLITAIGNVALAGLTLSPDKRLGYLIPRKGKVYFETSYMGKKEILIQAGVVMDVWANLVYENDEFIPIEGSDRKLIHNLPRNPFDMNARGKVIGGYWMAVMQNGEKPFGLIGIDRINEIKGRSESVKSGKQSAWDTDFEEMAKKTLINNAYKYLPKTNISSNVLAILDIEADNENEDYAEFRKAQEVDAAKKRDQFDDDGPADRKVYAEYAEVVPDELKQASKKPKQKSEPTPEEIEAEILALERDGMAEPPREVRLTEDLKKPKSTQP